MSNVHSIETSYDERNAQYSLICSSLNHEDLHSSQNVTIFQVAHNKEGYFEVRKINEDAVMFVPRVKGLYSFESLNMELTLMGFDTRSASEIEDAIVVSCQKLSPVETDFHHVQESGYLSQMQRTLLPVVLEEENEGDQLGTGLKTYLEDGVRSGLSTIKEFGQQLISNSPLTDCLPSAPPASPNFIRHVKTD